MKVLLWNQTISLHQLKTQESEYTKQAAKVQGDHQGFDLNIRRKFMWRMLAVMRRNIQNVRKSPRVADESMLGNNVNGAELPILVHDMNGRRSQRGGWNAFSVIYSVVRAPLSIVSCFSQPHVNGADGVWVSGEFAQISEMNHLMVSDSMRYAILM